MPMFKQGVLHAIPHKPRGALPFPILMVLTLSTACPHPLDRMPSPLSSRSRPHTLTLTVILLTTVFSRSPSRTHVLTLSLSTT